MIEETRAPPLTYGYGVRHVQAAIFFLCFTIIFISRSHMAVTIVAMSTGHKENSLNFNHSITNIQVNEANPLRNNNVNITISLHNTDDRYQYVFDWPKSTQEIVSGSFYWGYFIMMFPVGLICQRWGGKKPLQIALLVNGITSFVAPWLTFWGGWRALCVCRILQGLTQVGTFPSVHALLSNWVPAGERAKITSFVYTGSSIGHLLAFQLAGLLADSPWGWPATFWLVGVICLIMFGGLTVFGAVSPMKHTTITMEERLYILETSNALQVKKLAIPWKAIFTSKPVWGTFATHVGVGISYHFFFSQVPSYIHYVLGVNVKNTALLSSLPIFATILLSVVFGWLSDYVTNKNVVSKKNTRRIFNSISQYGTALTLLCVALTDNTALTVACFFLTMGLDAAANSGWTVNYIDLAPNFTGFLLATGATMMNIGNIIFPIMVSLVITDVTNITQWRILFFIVAGVSIVTNTVFILLLSAEAQPWNFVQNDVKEEQTIHLMTEKNTTSSNSGMLGDGLNKLNI